MDQGVSVQDLISIIVPVYNTEKYLDQCIQSVLAQTYTNWELLLIDDGSTDSSGAICDKHATEDSRIKVLHKENTGVSDSKNKALDIAQGDYIMFLDSDDYWCMDNCLEQLIATSKKLNADIVRGEYKAVDGAGDLLFERAVNAAKRQAVNQSLAPYQFLTEIIQGEFFLWLSLIKRSAIQNIRFNTHRIFLEDAEFLLLLLSNKLICIYQPLRFYNYRKHATAVTVKPNPIKLKNAFEFSSFCFIQAHNNIEDPQLSTECARIGIKNYLFDIKTITYECNWNTLCVLIKRHELNELLQETKKIILQKKLLEYSWLIALPTKALLLFYKTKHYIRRHLKK